jgi:hypothetical protein
MAAIPRIKFILKKGSSILFFIEIIFRMLAIVKARDNPTRKTTETKTI